MKRFVAVAVVLLASPAAYAGETYYFDIGGRTVTIEAPGDCRSTDCISVYIPGIYDSGTKRSRRQRDRDARDQTPIDPRPEAATKPVEEPKSVAAPAQVEASTTPTGKPTASVPMQPPTPHDTVSAPQPSSEPAATPTPSTAIANVSSATSVTGQDTSMPVIPSATVSPLGIWMTEKKEGKVRIEQCGTNLCGYSVNAKTDANGDKVLINMKPGSNKWTGRIFDPNNGSTYDSTIALKGSDSLRVQGCAFGGMFCGGQTWTRVN